MHRYFVNVDTVIWKELKDEVVTLSGYDIEFSPLHCIKIATVDSAKNDRNAKLIGILLYVVWKTRTFCIFKDAPSVKNWYKGVKNNPFEEIDLHDNIKGFVEIRQPVIAVDPSGLDFVLPN